MVGTRRARVVSYVLVFTLIISIAALFYVLNTKTPLYKDDYSYSYTFAVKENKFKIENFDQVIESQINHYKVMNGRAVAHTLAQTFLIFDKSVFNLINTLAFIGIIMLICFHGTGKKCPSPLYLILSFGMLWLFTPAFGQSFLWLTGACNYLWGIFIILLFLISLRLSYTGEVKLELTTKIVFAPFYFLFAVIAGNTNENTSASLIVMSLLFIVFTKVKHRKFPIWSLTGLAGNICGFLLLILAPGQQTRLDNNGGFGKIEVWLERFSNISTEFVKRFGIVLALIIIITVVGFIRRKKLGALTVSIIFFTGTLASVYSMILSPYFPERVWSGPCVLIAITLISVIHWALGDIKIVPKVVISTVTALAVVSAFIYTYIGAYNALSITKAADEKRIEDIINYKRQGISEVTLDSIYGYSKYDPYDSYGDLNDDSTTWPNTAVAMYYGLDEVRKK